MGDVISISGSEYATDEEVQALLDALDRLSDILKSK
jgi:hypothetical protein